MSPAPVVQADRWSGVVSWFDAAKGFGFLAADDDPAPVFVEYTGIEGPGYRTLHAGQPVTFVRTVGPRGPEAGAVRAVV
ncbi:cold-shock protein [Nocardia asteroides]|uniref:cold-shock protein n=1 Tax=Nocardia asteroides TaxID=1824 RepID=UPI001E5A9420|nr:cold-shock protein [Nocardia asteroides]UGT65140.1 cold-shock protein [Nocardia asteroides]